MIAVVAGLTLLTAAAPPTTAQTPHQGESPDHGRREAAPTPPRHALEAMGLVDRIAGADRYEQAVRVSRSGFVHADTVYLASGEEFADALSAASVAGIRRSPLLLVRQHSLPPGLLPEIGRLTPSVVVAVGGRASIADSALVELSRGAPGVTVVRVEGVDRYDTSRRLIADRAVGAFDAEGLVIAGGASFPDALSASSPAAHLGMPVLLVDGAEPSTTAEEAAFLDDLGPGKGIIVGGVHSVGAALQRSLESRLPIERVEGDDRYATAVAINRRAYATAADVYLASGTGWADALSGGPLAAVRGAPLLIIRPDCVPNGVTTELRRLSPRTVTLLGGPASLAEGAEELRPC